MTAPGFELSSARLPRVDGVRLVVGLSGIVVVLLVWELLSRTEVLPSRYFPPASAVLARVGQLVLTPALWNVVGLTLKAWSLGLGIAVVIAVPVGVVLGSSDRMYGLFRVVIEVLRPIPPVVLIPLALLILGATLQMKLLLIVYGAVWPLLMQTIYGVRSVDPHTLEMARAYRLRPTQRFVQVRLAGATPYIATGIRISATLALIVSVVAELVGGAPGLGNDILLAQSSGENTLMYALIVVTGLVGVIIIMVFQRLERSILFWHPSQRGENT